MDHATDSNIGALIGACIAVFWYNCRACKVNTPCMTPLLSAYWVDVHDKNVLTIATQRDLIEIGQFYSVLQGQCFGIENHEGSPCHYQDCRHSLWCVCVWEGGGGRGGGGGKGIEKML